MQRKLRRSGVKVEKGVGRDGAAAVRATDGYGERERARE